MRITKWKCKPCAAAWMAIRRRRLNGMALTLADARARVETDLDDTTLQRILDAAVEDVNRHAGDAASATETKLARGLRYISLNRRATTITEITERATPYQDAVTLVVDDDYRRVGDYRVLRVTSCWGAEVVVTYTPEVDTELRDRATLDLVQVDVEFRAYQSEDEGDWTGNQADYDARRHAVLAQVREGRSPVL